MMTPNETTQQHARTFRFDDDNDLFGRKIIAENIIKLLEAGDEFFPLVIDGGWGTGKTTFVKRFKTLCEEKKIGRIVYVNAFQADHADDPFMMILAAVINSIKDSASRDKTIDNISSKVPIIGTKILKFGASVICNKVIGVDYEIAKDMLTTLSRDDLLSASKVLLEDYIDSYRNVSELKKILSDLLENGRIVIIIDELDRCRPDFAVGVLEAAKHIFDIKDVNFIFAANLEQIKKSLQNRYGDLVSVDQYLQKFIGHSTELPNSEIPPKTYLSFLLAKNNEIAVVLDKHIEFINIIMELNNVSFRDIEKILKNIKILLLKKRCSLLSDKNHPLKELIWDIKIFAAVVYTLKFSLSKNMEAENIRKEDLLSALDTDIKKEYSNNRNLFLIKEAINSGIAFTKPKNECTDIQRVFYDIEKQMPTCHERVRKIITDTFNELRYLHDIPADLYPQEEL